MMDRCMVCLESNADIFSRITTQSSEWQESHIQRIIEKHLWWWYLKKAEGVFQWICRQCWQEISSFHNFYIRVEMVHKQFQPLVGFGITNLDGTQNRIGKQEKKVENHGSFLIEGLMPLQRRRKRKVRKSNNIENLQIEELNNADVKNEFDLKITDFVEDFNHQSSDIEASEKHEKDTLDITVERCSDNDFSYEYKNHITASDNKGKSKVKKVKTKKVKFDSKSKSKEVVKKEIIKKDIRPDAELFHEDQNKLECDICNVSLDNFSILRTHFRIEHNTRGYAMCCGKKYTKRCLLIDHINVSKNPEYFKCQQCNKSFNIRDCHDKHMKVHMTRERKFKCEECGKLFFEQKILSYHMLSHVPENERTVPCKNCDKKFPSALHLKQHELGHDKKKFKVCEICGRSFGAKFSFQRHMNEHAGIPTSCETCNICGLKLVHKTALKQHIKNRHTEENLKQQICPYCTKATPSVNALRQHIQYSHTMERKHACNLCDKSFKRPVELKEHLSSHTGEALYTCPHCPRTFISNANMHKHRKIVHRIEWEKGKLKNFIEPRRIGVAKNSILESINNNAKIQKFSNCKNTQNCTDNPLVLPSSLPLHTKMC